MGTATAAFVSFRLGRADGVSVVAETWRQCFEQLGYATVTVAGDGPVDRLVPGLAIDAHQPPTRAEVGDVIRDADLVVVENLLTIPLNLPASRVVAETLRGRPALLHHHDPPWQRARFAHVTELPADDPAWRHVTITRLTAAQLAQRGIVAQVVYDAVEVGPVTHQPAAVRAELGVDPCRPLLLHPVRAIERKDIPVAIALAEAARGTYWLSGPVEEDYGPTLERLLAAARVPVVRRTFDDAGKADAYAAADVILYPSTWEGFGLPPIEAALLRRPVAVGPYPAADELRSLGFRWLPTDDPGPLGAALASPAELADDLEHNHALATLHFTRPVLLESLRALLSGAGWLA